MIKIQPIKAIRMMTEDWAKVFQNGIEIGGPLGCAVMRNALVQMIREMPYTAGLAMMAVEGRSE